MKKIIIVFLIFMFATPCFALQNYMLIADHEISKVRVSDENVITVRELNSYCNTKNSIIIVAKNIGISELSFCKGKKHIKLKVNVKEDETCIKRINGVKLISVDLPLELK